MYIYIHVIITNYYVYIPNYIYMYIYIHVIKYTCIYTYMWLSRIITCIYLYIPNYIYVCIYIHVIKYTCIYVYMWLSRIITCILQGSFAERDLIREIRHPLHLRLYQHTLREAHKSMYIERFEIQIYVHREICASQSIDLWEIHAESDRGREIYTWNQCLSLLLAHA